jgi:hypothetical protein
MLLSNQQYNWPSLQVPSKPYSLNIHDVLIEEAGGKRDAMLHKWMVDVWQCWEHQHTWIRDISKSLLR